MRRGILLSAAMLAAMVPQSAHALHPIPGDTCFFGGAGVSIQAGLHPRSPPGTIACRVLSTNYATAATVESVKFMRWHAGDACGSGLPETACHDYGAPIWIVRIRGEIQLCVGVGPCATVATAYFLLDDKRAEVFAFGTP